MEYRTLVGLSSIHLIINNVLAGGSTSAGLFMTFGDSCVEHFNEYVVTSSIGRVDATELSLESNTDLTVNESLQIPQYATNPPVTSSAGEVWYNTAEENFTLHMILTLGQTLLNMIQGRDSTNIVGSTQ